MSSVSLIIPCYNNAATLGRAVTSGFAQELLHEIIIVDNGSTDDSLATARQLQARDERVRVVQMERNSGSGAARNFGVSYSNGNYVSFLDADDELIGKDFFVTALGVIAANPGMVVVKCAAEFFDPAKGHILPKYDPRYQVAVLSSVLGMVMARDAFLRINGFSESETFRGSFAGKDVVFMQAVMEHLQPIGRVEKVFYRCWSQAGSDIDRFLANTRLTKEGFEFVSIHEQQR